MLDDEYENRIAAKEEIINRALANEMFVHNARRPIERIINLHEDETGIYIEGEIKDARFADTIMKGQTRRYSMEEKAVKWLKAHRRDIALVVVTALVTAKFAKGRTVVYEGKEGTFKIPASLFDKI